MIEKFCTRLLQRREELMAKVSDVDDKRLDRLQKALGFTVVMRSGATGMGLLEKVKTILDSNEALVQHFPKVVDAYYELATRKEAQTA